MGSIPETVPVSKIKAEPAGIPVTLSEPSSPRGVTFLLTGFMIDESEYDSTRAVLHGKDQVVICLRIAKGGGEEHQKYANDVAKIHEDYRGKHPSLPSTYNVVGHSAGGKVALLVAAKADPTNVGVVVALDPVDLKPVEFTNKGSQTNLTLENTSGNVHIRWATKTRSWIPFGNIPEDHNARAIFEANRRYNNVAPLVEDDDASHFAYTDRGGGWIGRLSGYYGGSSSGNAKARTSAHDMIRELI